MLRVTCDTCGKPIDIAEPGWFGVDHAQVDDYGELTPVEDYHRFHFDSADCLIGWLMERSYSPSSEETS